jgi:hypothetical protein
LKGFPRFAAQLLTVLSVALATVPARLARAQDAPTDKASTILLLEARKEGVRQREALVRVSGELRAAGFRVVFVERGDREVRDALTDALAAQGALAAISLEELARGRGVEVWVNDRATGKLSIRTLESSEAPAVMAVRAVELLRASLLELKHPAKAPEATPPPEVASLLAEELVSVRAGLQAELAFAFAAGVDPPVIGVSPGLRLSWTADFGLGARLSYTGPILGMSLPGRLGDADLDLHVACAELLYSPPIHPWIGVEGALGLGAAYLRARGDLLDPARARSDELARLTFSASLGLLAKLHRHVGLSVDGTILVMAPSMPIAMADERVGTVGLPTFVVRHGVVVAF